MIGADCIDPKTNDLRPESPCAKAKRQLNQGVPLWDVFYDRFFSTTKPNMNKYVIQTIIEAETLKDALKDVPGEITSGALRPTPPVQPQRPIASPALAQLQTPQAQA